MSYPIQLTPKEKQKHSCAPPAKKVRIADNKRAILAQCPRVQSPRDPPPLNPQPNAAEQTPLHPQPNAAEPTSLNSQLNETEQTEFKSQLNEAEQPTHLPPVS